ncbi:DUF2851 family protein [Candidatus Sumerlaeota bacterium]|nr:DUF2851 family protein [Candidatus Sumerlaeota bacterium]
MIMYYLHYYNLLADAIAEHYQSDRVGEANSEPHPVDEALVQCIWAEQLLRPEALRTFSGLPLVVLNPGDWNTGGHGPDFRKAQLRIDGRAVSGDVEIHLHSSDFRAHGHQRDYEYNRVALHVFLSCTDGETHDLLHNGQRCERLELEPVLFPDLETLRRTISPSEIRLGEPGPAGKCNAVFQTWDFQTIRDFLNAMGRERLEHKARRLEDQLAGRGVEQAFYQSMMSLMGLRGSRALYYLLAQRAPLSELRQQLAEVAPEGRTLLLESILLHVANLLPDAEGEARLDDAERSYLEALRKAWLTAEPYFSDRVIARSKRWMSGVRPGNFPMRRLAGVARWLRPRLAETNFLLRLRRDFQAAAPQVWSRANARRFEKQRSAGFVAQDSAAHWAMRYSWGGKLAKSPNALIGEAHAQSITLNALLPALLLIARHEQDAALEDQLFKFWSLYPALPPNQVVKAMQRRLFHGVTLADDLFNTEQRRQALHHVHHQLCNGNLSSCEQCVFFHNPILPSHPEPLE